MKLLNLLPLVALASCLPTDLELKRVEIHNAELQENHVVAIKLAPEPATQSTYQIRRIQVLSSPRIKKCKHSDPSSVELLNAFISNKAENSNNGLNDVPIENWDHDKACTSADCALLSKEPEVEYEKVSDDCAVVEFLKGLLEDVKAINFKESLTSIVESPAMPFIVAAIVFFGFIVYGACIVAHHYQKSLEQKQEAEEAADVKAALLGEYADEEEQVQDYTK